MKTKKMTSFPFPLNPRLSGIREQYRRARKFLSLARRCKRRESTFRNALAAVYPARAIVELMLEAVSKEELPQFGNRDQFEEWLSPKLPFYALIEKIRIHDFHRFGCLPPDPRVRGFFFGGPTKLTARKGAAAVQFTATGPKTTTTGSSAVKPQRPLINTDGFFFDDDSGKYVDLCGVLDSFLAPVPAILRDFEAMQSGQQGPAGGPSMPPGQDVG